MLGRQTEKVEEGRKECGRSQREAARLGIYAWEGARGLTVLLGREHEAVNWVEVTGEAGKTRGHY